jgi:GntR family transcriptional repressor for pyruvate dehydrogenase complex
VPKAADLVANHIRGLVIRGELGEGDSLPAEAVLMAELGVSRGTLREAFRVLESDSLISVRRGSTGGARVHLPTEDVAARHAAFVLQLRGTTLAEVLEARAVFEPPIAGLAASKRTNAQLARLRSLAEVEQQQELDPRAEAATMRAFHRELIEAAGNRALTFLSSMIDRIVTQSAESWAESTSVTARRGAIAKLHTDHVQLVELISAKDSEAAEELWRGHLAQPTRTSLQRRPISDLFL